MLSFFKSSIVSFLGRRHWPLLSYSMLNALFRVVGFTLSTPGEEHFLLASTQQQRAYSLAALPQELLVEILTQLEWADVINSRVLCKSLHSASRARAVWLSIFWRISDSLAVPLIPPKPLNLYSTSELEALVVKWIRTDIGWSSCSVRQQPPRQRITTCSHQGPYILVEGGRWLLTSDDSGCVYAHDLDSPHADLGVYPLISLQAEAERDQLQMTIDMDRSSPTLAFNIVLEPDNLEEPATVSIWRVVLSDSAGGTRLVATRLAHLHPQLEAVMDVSLFQSLFARIVDGRFVEIFDWQMSTSSSHLKSIIKVDSQYGMQTAVRILPGQKLLVAGRTYLQLFSIPELASHDPTLLFSATAPAHAAAPLQVIPWVREDICRLSPMYMAASEDAYLTLATKHAFYGLCLSTHVSSSTQLNISKLVEDSLWKRYSHYSIDLHRALIKHMHRPGSIIASNFLRGQGYTVAEHSWDDAVEMTSFFKADEWSGRTVDRLENGPIMIVELSV